MNEFKAPDAPEVIEGPNAPKSNPEHQMVLFRFRVELYSAAQLFKGRDLEDLITLIDEVRLVAESERQTALLLNNATDNNTNEEG